MHTRWTDQRDIPDRHTEEIEIQEICNLSILNGKIEFKIKI
jgi:hypothetical protein